MRRLGELIGSEVVDRDGTVLGRIHDVRLVQDGPLVEGFGAALRVEGLVVADRPLGIRLGYQRHAVHGPLLLNALFTRLARRARFVPWDQVASWEGGRVELRVPAGDLPGLPPAD
jgi:hypothetical protein